MQQIRWMWTTEKREHLELPVIPSATSKNIYSTDWTEHILLILISELAIACNVISFFGVFNLNRTRRKNPWILCYFHCSIYHEMAFSRVCSHHNHCNRSYIYIWIGQFYLCVCVYLSLWAPSHETPTFSERSRNKHFSQMLYLTYLFASFVGILCLAAHHIESSHSEWWSLWGVLLIYYVHTQYTDIFL